MLIPWKDFKNAQDAFAWAKGNMQHLIRTGDREITFKGPRRFLDEKVKL